MNINKKNTANKKDKSIIILIIIIVSGLFLVFYKEEIKSYFRFKKIQKEVLNNANVFNIPDVAVACFDIIKETNSDASTSIISDKCNREIKKWGTDITRWKELIQNEKDINCRDFLNGKDAKNFYHYISGELAGCFYLYNKSPSPEKFSFWGECNCTYDPYGLDTNGDCNACENY